MKITFLPWLFSLLLILTGRAVFAYDWENYKVEDIEEPGGVKFALEGNWADGIYGASFERGAWIRNTPIYGDVFLSTFRNDIEAATYGGIGLILRLMPHRLLAPYVGGGGSYNQVFASDNSTDAGTDRESGQSYAAAHAEAGLRLQPGDTIYELTWRYTWPASSIEDADYWTLRLGYGFVF